MNFSNFSPNVTDPSQAYQFNDENVKYNVRRMILPRTDKNGLSKVYIEVHRYSQDQPLKFKRISTDVWVNPKDWNKNKELVNGKDPDADTKNTQIEKKHLEVLQFINSKGQQHSGQSYVEQMSFESLAEFFPESNIAHRTLVDWFDQYIKHRKAIGTINNTLKEFTTVRNRIRDFDQHRGENSYLSKLTLLWSDEFNLFLVTKYSQGTIEKTFTVLITVLNHFYDRREEMNISVSDKFKAKGFKHGQKSCNSANPLTSEQVKALYNHRFDEPHLERTRERFLWQCFTGLRYCDAFKITRKDINNNMIWYMPSKTLRHRVRVEQPLNPVALELLEKYEYDMTCLAIANQPYNRELKQMFQKMNEKYPDLHYDESCGSYASRDTFISRLVENGVPVHNILKYSGQSSFSILNRYTKTSDKMKQEEVDRVFSIPV